MASFVLPIISGLTGFLVVVAQNRPTLTQQRISLKIKIRITTILTLLHQT